MKNYLVVAIGGLALSVISRLATLESEALGLTVLTLFFLVLKIKSFTLISHVVRVAEVATPHSRSTLFANRLAPLLWVALTLVLLGLAVIF